MAEAVRVSDTTPPPPVLEVRDLKQHFVISHGFLRRARGHACADEGEAPSNWLLQ